MDEKEKIRAKIEDLNSIRAMYHKEFKEIERKHKGKKISDKDFEKLKRKYDKRAEKIRLKINKLEKKFEKLKEEIS